MTQRTGRVIQAIVYFAVVAALVGMASGVFAQQSLSTAPHSAYQIQCRDAYYDLFLQALRLSDLTETDEEKLYYLGVHQQLLDAVSATNEWYPVETAERLCAQPRLDAIGALALSWRQRADALAEARERKRQHDLEALIEQLLGHAPTGVAGR